jgi:hypothetical protein
MPFIYRLINGKPRWGGFLYPLAQNLKQAMMPYIFFHIHLEPYS